MLKRLIAILFILAFSAKFIANMAIVTWHQANQEYYIKNYCVNKYKPEKLCYAQCKLVNDLKKVEIENTKDDIKPQKLEHEVLALDHFHSVFFDSF